MDLLKVGHGVWQHKPCVERRYTLSADKLPVCLPELGLSGKTPVVARLL